MSLLQNMNPLMYVDNNSAILFMQCIIFLTTLDIMSIGLFKLLNKQVSPTLKIIPHNARWFFIHFVSNLVVTVIGIEDLKYCLNNVTKCAYSQWTEKTSEVFTLVNCVHIYHAIVFKNYLKKDEWIHHSVMAICSFLAYFFNHTKITTVSMWFLSGLPGAIDYFLLWLIKIGHLQKNIEKKAYVCISLLLRSPGCVISTLLQILSITIDNSLITIFIKLFIAFLVFGNGQYYMYVTIKDAAKQKYI